MKNINVKGGVNISNNLRKAAIYARVSKIEGQNPQKQVKELKNYAKSKGYIIYKVYIDKISGTKSNRPALMELLKDAHDHKFNCILVWKLDRLGRSLQHLIKVVNYFKTWNIDFICTSQNLDTTTSDGMLIFHIMGAMAQFERDLISERTKLGLKGAKGVGKRGKDKGKRRTWGYRKENKQKKGTPIFWGFDKE